MGRHRARKSGNCLVKIRKMIDVKLRELDAVEEEKEVSFAQDSVAVYAVMLETMYA